MGQMRQYIDFIESPDLEYFKPWWTLNSGFRLDRNAKSGDIL